MGKARSGWFILPIVVLCSGLGRLPAAPVGDDDAALRRRALALNDVTGEKPVAGEIKSLVGEPKGTKKLLAVAMKMAKEKDQPFNFNGAYILAEAALQLKDLDSSRSFFRICIEEAGKLQSDQKIAQALDGVLQVSDRLQRAQKMDDSFNVLKETVETMEKQNPSPRKQLFTAEIMRRMVRSLTLMKRLDEAKKMKAMLNKAQPNYWRNAELDAWFEQATGHETEAAKLYESLITQIGKDENLEDGARAELQDEVRYLLSGLYIDLNQVDKASQQLQTLLSKHPDEATFNNDLGYIWADHDMKLDEAEKLIRKALELDRKKRKEVPDLKPEQDKDNSAYLDSLAWVLYKKKNLKDARKYLEEAIKAEEGQHIEIFDHLADVYAALGEKDQAKAMFEKALKSAGPGKREQDKKAQVEKKLKAMK
jgi:tetratricopeptide (TPR) repeat protein